DWPMPDLILLDGGLGHLNMAKELLHEQLGLAVNIVSVAKGPTRKNLKLQTSNLKLNQEIQNILKDKFLVKHIMDEAHRFAITFHRKLRSKSAF
ncbi:MAG: excinuclease ABC subunit C, partial [Candidatus Moranbacteria bacterium]|nr:excinuclease ABC subunit C [Candidatus Moranbacteria bacterium]